MHTQIEKLLPFYEHKHETPLAELTGHTQVH